MTSPGFVHLHTHTDASLVDGLNRVRPMVAKAQLDGQMAIAATDHGSIASWFQLHAECAKTDGAVFPIYGQEMYLAIGDRREHNSIVASGATTDDGEDKEKTNYHLTVIAENETGYRNLIRLTNAAQDSFWNKPRIDLALLKSHSEGLIVLTGCLGGPVTHHLVAGDLAGAQQNLSAIVDAVGHDNVYVEMMEHGIATESAVQEQLVELARANDLPWVVTNDAHFTAEEDATAHEAWLLVGSKKTLNDTDRWKFPGEGYWIKTDEQMRAVRSEDWWETGCDETVRIAKRIGGDVFPEYPVRLPQFPLPEGFTDSADYLRHLVREGAFKRYGEDPERPGKLAPEINERLKFEFGVVTGAGFADYFLIVWELVTWVRSQGHLVGPGRGSGAGSAMAYVLGITQVEPLSNGLLFERFLDVERVGMPDFDIDFEKLFRSHVVGHLVDRYGADAVAKIGTKGIVRSRMAIKDACRVLGVNATVGARLAKMIPIDSAKPRPLALLREQRGAGDPQVDPFWAEVTKYGDDAQAVVDLAERFELSTRQESIHACGVLVCDQPMDSLVPVRRDREGEKGTEGGVHVPRVTSWEGPEVEALGFLKIDVLGLRTLDVLAMCAKYIQQSTGEVIDAGAIHPEHVTDPDRHRRAWELIAAGQTEGVFQLESPRMTELAMDVEPTSLADVTALVALYRPGPMSAGMHTRFADRKRGREAVDYSYLTVVAAEQEVIGAVLDATLGVIVYQEAIMRLSGDIGGFSAGQRNQLRKAFSKKQADKMAELKDVFIDGGMAGEGSSGIAFQRSTLEKLWVTFEGSAEYLFNASHAAAYGVLAYATAYMKANWQPQFAAALLSVTSDDGKRAAIMKSLSREGVEILAPDINESQALTAPSSDGSKVLFGLSEIKAFGKVATDVIGERVSDGPYRSLADLLGRVSMTSLQAEALIESGACDAFGSRKGQMRLVRAAKGNAWLKPDPSEWGVVERSRRQRDRIGVSVGVHPLDAVGTDLAKEVGKELKAAEAIGDPHLPRVARVQVRDLGSSRKGKRVIVGGVLVSWDERAYSKGRMASAVLEGAGGERVEMVAWNRELEDIHAAFGEDGPQVGGLAIVVARVDMRSYSTEVVGDDGSVTEQTFNSVQLMLDRLLQPQLDTGAVPDDSPPCDKLVGALVAATERRAQAEADFEAGRAPAPTTGDNEPMDVHVESDESELAVRMMPRRLSPMNAGSHLLPADALSGTSVRMWRIVAPSGVAITHVVAAADAPLHDIVYTRRSQALDTPDELGFAAVLSDDPTAGF